MDTIPMGTSPGRSTMKRTQAPLMPENTPGFPICPGSTYANFSSSAHPSNATCSTMPGLPCFRTIALLTKSNPEYLEFLEKDVSKGSALRIWLDHNRVRRIRIARLRRCGKRSGNAAPGGTRHRHGECNPGPARGPWPHLRPILPMDERAVRRGQGTGGPVRVAASLIARLIPGSGTDQPAAAEQSLC